MGKRLFGGYFLPGAAVGPLVLLLLPPVMDQVVESRGLTPAGSHLQGSYWAIFPLDWVCAS